VSPIFRTLFGIIDDNRLPVKGWAFTEFVSAKEIIIAFD
jgi:hypothetical protein